MDLLQRLHVFIVLISLSASSDGTFFFEKQPEDAVMEEGDEGILYCSINSPDTPDLTYKWYRQDAFEGDSTVNSLDTLQPIVGKSQPTLNLDPVKRADKGYYHCMVESLTYKLVSNIAYIQVNHFDQPPAPQLKIESFTNNRKSAFLSCATPDSSPIMGVEWIKDNEVVLDERMFVIPADVTFSGVEYKRGSLMIMNIDSQDDSGQYMCQTKKAVDGQKIKLSEYEVKTASGSNAIYEAPQLVYSSEESPKIIAGTSVTMACAYIGYPTPRYRWYLVNGQEEVKISGSDSISISDNNRRLVASNVAADSNYKCVAYNEKQDGTEQTRDRTFYIVTINDDSDYNIDILKGPTPFTVLKPNLYRPFILECSVRSTGSIQIQWLKNLKPLSDSRIIPENSNSKIDGKDATNRNLKFVIPNESDLGLYQCVMFNSKGMKIKAAYVTLEKDELKYSLEVMDPEYFMLQGTFKVDKGEEACRERDGHLVSILSVKENADVLSQVPKDVSSVWIGLTSEKPDIEGAWLWTQPGENSAIYSNWIIGKPDHKEQQYAIMKTKPDSTERGKWEDVDNSGKYHVMCKKYIARCESIDKAYDGRVRTAGWEEVNAKYVIGEQVEVFCRLPGKEKLKVGKVTCGSKQVFTPYISEKECSVVPSSALSLNSIVIISILTLLLFLL